MQEREESEVGFIVEEDLQEWQEALYQTGLGKGTKNIDEGVRKSVLKGINKMRNRTLATEGRDCESGRRFGTAYSSCGQHSNQILGTSVGVIGLCQTLFLFTRCTIYRYSLWLCMSSHPCTSYHPCMSIQLCRHLNFCGSSYPAYIL